MKQLLNLNLLIYISLMGLLLMSKQELVSSFSQPQATSYSRRGYVIWKRSKNPPCTILNSHENPSQTDSSSSSSSSMRKENNKRLKRIMDRRRRSLFLRFAGVTTYAISSTLKPELSHAGWVQFPCYDSLQNTYHFMRSGQSLLESQDIISTNPLFLTNRDDALSSLGIEQVEKACEEMLAHDINPGVIKYSLAAKCMDTVNLIANIMQVGRNRIIPEYTFMDPRGVGRWDMQKLSAIEPAVWALDMDKAGNGGRGGVTPNDDGSHGTPNEALYHQVTRLSQLISVLETQFQGETILLVFPDGTGPALLSSLIAGIPLNQVHKLNYTPGEVRYDVTMKNVLNNFNKVEEEASPFYSGLINEGRANLKLLDSSPDHFAFEEEVSSQAPVYQEQHMRQPQHNNPSKSGNNASTLNLKQNSDEDVQSSILPPPSQHKSKLNHRHKKSSGFKSDNEEQRSIEAKTKVTDLQTNKMTPEEKYVPLIGLGVVAMNMKKRTPSANSNTSKQNTEQDHEEIKDMPQQQQLDMNEERSDLIIDEEQVEENYSGDEISSFEEVKKMETLVTQAPFDIPEMQSDNDEEEQVLQAEKIDSAEKAMDDYLSADDGYDDWLQTLSTLVNDGDNDATS